MPESSHKVIHPESIYDVIELIGTSTESWEDAAKNVIEQAGEHARAAHSGGRDEGHDYSQRQG